ncbi:MAG: hypothetical protein MK188_05330 [Gammaproteobacteria bacterium]|nr:hypothetical protein [Gammaproteobacteria bacterium]
MGYQDLTRPKEADKPVAVLLADEIVSDDLKQVYGHMCKASLLINGKTLLERTMEELSELGFEQCIILAGINAYEISDDIDRLAYPNMEITVFHYARVLGQVLKELRNMSIPSGMLIVEVNNLRNQRIGLFLREALASDYVLLQAVSKGQQCGLTLLKPSKSQHIQNAMPVVLDDLVISKLNTLDEVRDVSFNLKCDKYFYSGEEETIDNRVN